MGFLLSICFQPSNDKDLTLTNEYRKSRIDRLSQIYQPDDSNKENIIILPEGGDCLIYSNKDL
jgi:hypothetical protein